MARKGSRFYAALDRRRWARARRLALQRAGHRSELSGLAGRLEVHHKTRLEDGGDPYALDNLQVLTRQEHIDLHRGDRETPGRAEWRKYVDELVHT